MSDNESTAEESPVSFKNPQITEGNSDMKTLIELMTIMLTEARVDRAQQEKDREDQKLDREERKKEFKELKELILGRVIKLEDNTDSQDGDREREREEIIQENRQIIETIETTRQDIQDIGDQITIKEPEDTIQIEPEIEVEQEKVIAVVNDLITKEVELKIQTPIEDEIKSDSKEVDTVIKLEIKIAKSNIITKHKTKDGTTWIVRILEIAKKNSKARERHRKHRKKRRRTTKKANTFKIKSKNNNNKQFEVWKFAKQKEHTEKSYENYVEENSHNNFLDRKREPPDRT